MTCSGMQVGPYEYGICYELAAYCWASKIACQCLSDGGDEARCDSGCSAPMFEEARYPEGVVCFTQRAFNACEVSPNFGSWLAAGQTLSSPMCYGAVVTPRYRNGVEIANYKQATPTGRRLLGDPPACTGEIQAFTTWTEVRTRSVECPPGYREAALPDGSVECRRSKPDRCTRTNNPIVLPTGGRELVQEDYRGHGPFPLAFVRYYATEGFYTPSPGQPAKSVIGELWRHTFERRIYAGTTSAVSATAHRHDGEVKDFDANGIEMGGCEVSQDRVEALTGPDGSSGWRYISSRNDEVETYDAAGKLLSIADRAGLAVTLEYSDETTPPAIAPGPGFLIEVTDAFGRQLAFAYDAEGRIVEMTAPGARTYTYRYDENMTGRPPGHLTSVTYPDANTRRYHYEPDLAGNRPHFLTGITDENGDRFATYAYDGDGRATRTEHAGGAGRQEVGYWSNGWVSLRRYVDEAEYLDRTLVFSTVNGLHRYRAELLDLPCPECGPRSQDIDPVTAMLTSRVDWNGNRTCYTHDSRGLEEERVEGLPSSATCPYTGALPAGARRVTTEWHPTWRLPVRVAEPKRLTTFLYDGDGGVGCGATGALCSETVQSTDDASGARGFSATPVGTPRRSSYTYDAHGQVLTIDGPRADVADVSAFEYWPADAHCPVSLPDASVTGCRGQPRHVTNPAGHVTTIEEYNAHGQPLRLVDPNGLATGLTYDARMRLEALTVGTEATRYRYDGVGQLTRITFPDESSIEHRYDAAHRLRETRDNLGNKIVYTLDAMGNRREEKVFDPAGALRGLHARVYNALNRLEKDIGGTDPAVQVTEYGYDDQGNLTSIDGPLTGTPNDRTQLAYDRLNRLQQVTDALSGVTGFTYDGLDRLDSVTDARHNTTSWDHNGLGDPTREVSPDRGTSQATFDPAGNMLTRTDARGKTTTFAYDALNRVRSMRFDDATPPILFTYDNTAQSPGGTGRLHRVSDERSGSTEFLWTREGRLRARVQRSATRVTLVAQWSYDAFGRKRTLKYPSGQMVSWTYDEAGRPRELRLGHALGPDQKLILRAERYFPFGEPEIGLWGNGRARLRMHDLDGRVSGLDVDDDQRALDYDPAGRVRAFLHETGATSNETMAYDVLDRLTGWRRQARARGYGYDPTGNRTSLVVDGTEVSYSVETTSNRLESAPGPGPGRRFTYDDAGNVVADGPMTLTYDARGRLVRSQRGAQVHEYLVDGLGGRVAKSGPGVPSGTNHFVYDERGHLLGVYGGRGVPIQEYVWWGDQPVAVLQDRGIYFVDTDHLGSPIRVRDGARQIVWRWDAVPFAENMPDEYAGGRAFVFNLRLPGQYFDQETGLHYNYFRDYDPQTGRYVQGDPIGLAGGINPYGYVNGNPMTWRDRLGLWPTPGHDYFIDRAYGPRNAFGPELPASAIAAMKQGSAMADAPLFQLPGFAHMHSMLSSSMTQEGGMAGQRAYVEERLAFAKNILCNPKLRARYSVHAYRAIGMALHPAMDSTSPPHARNATHWNVWSLLPNRGPGERLGLLGIPLLGYLAQAWENIGRHKQAEAADQAPLYEALTIGRMREVFDPGAFGCGCR